jgi:hypothetical protein
MARYPSIGRDHWAETSANTREFLNLLTTVGDGVDESSSWVHLLVHYFGYHHSHSDYASRCYCAGFKRPA